VLREEQGFRLNKKGIDKKPQITRIENGHYKTRTQIFEFLFLSTHTRSIGIDMAAWVTSSCGLFAARVVELDMDTGAVVGPLPRGSSPLASQPGVGAGAARAARIPFSTQASRPWPVGVEPGVRFGIQVRFLSFFGLPLCLCLEETIFSLFL
jgi:hypothetical protein